MMLTFKHKSKDIVFVVNTNIQMSLHLEDVKESLRYIFDSGLETSDRISLISYSKNCRVTFSLVDKTKNFIQLRN